MVSELVVVSLSPNIEISAGRGVLGLHQGNTGNTSTGDLLNNTQFINQLLVLPTSWSSKRCQIGNRGKCTRCSEDWETWKSKRRSNLVCKDKLDLTLSCHLSISGKFAWWESFIISEWWSCERLLVVHCVFSGWLIPCPRVVGLDSTQELFHSTLSPY